VTNLTKARVLCLFLSALLASPPLAADDLADEADLQFTLGTEAYQKGDLRSALEHFLASNRLAPNRNVLYNIARVYDAMKRYPEAYRYYSQALDGEKDAQARAAIESALTQLAASVVVVRIETSPPGATLYVDRKDLGPRGTAPRTLGLAPGNYRVLAELPGYAPGEALIESAVAGEERRVTLELQPILGTLFVNGSANASLRLEDPEAPPRCRLPCELSLPPGSYRAFATAPGHRPSELRVTILASQRTTTDAALEPLTGTLVVNTDEPQALIEVDGKPRGFTPSILTLNVGRHRVDLVLAGFRRVSRVVDVNPSSEGRLDVALVPAEEVRAASRVGESVEDAPGSVTIVPKKELVALAAPTIAEAVRGVPGVYLWNDRSYVSVGVRGLGRLGSYGNRMLVLYDGQPMNDDWIGSSYVGFDALTDLGDVERIEVVRGPGSVLYGTNAFSGVVNVVNDHERPTGASVGVGTSQDGVARARVRGDLNLGRDAGVWTTVGAARSSGRDFEYPELGAEAAGVDGFESAGFRGGARYRFIHAQWSFNHHDKQLPTGAFETTIGDPRTHQTDTRGMVEVRAEPKLSDSVQSLTRVHGNLYRFRGDYARPPQEGGVGFDRFRGAWIGLEQRLILTPLSSLRLTVGGEAQFHVQVEQTVSDETAVYLDDSHPYQVGAAYANADLDLTAAAKLSAGARFDVYSTFGSSLSPHGALILRPYPNGNLKILGGRAFRAPSIYELYYNDGGVTQVANPTINPELIYSGEIEHTHRFSPTMLGSVTLYENYAKDLILAAGTGGTGDPLHYVNSQVPLVTLGFEAGVRRDWRQGFMIGVSYGFTHARFLASESASDFFTLEKHSAIRDVANAPAHLATLKGAAPIIAQKLLATTRLSVESKRYDRYELQSDPLQGTTAPFVLWDIVITGHEPRFNLDYAFGVYNAFDWKYSLPVGGELAQRSIQQDGRTFLASAEVSF